jgi:hypothetical protein
VTLKARVDLHDREIAAIRKLILAGMKMINRAEERADRADRRMDRLEASQRETNRMLQELIRSLRGGTNGHRAK